VTRAAGALLAALLAAALLSSPAFLSAETTVCGPTTPCTEGSRTTFDFIPTGAPVVTGATSALTANAMKCTNFVKHGPALALTKYVVSFGVSAGSCSICLYHNADAGALIAPKIAGVATAIDCSVTNTLSGLDAFHLLDATQYRLCWTSDNATTTWTASGSVTSLLVNTLATTQGTAANGSAVGVCPATTGALGTAATLAIPSVLVAQ